MTGLGGRSHAFDAAMVAVGEAAWDDPAGPVVVPFWPVSSGNPYQQLVHAGLARRDALAVPAWDVGTAVRLAQELEGDARVVAHLHWLDQVLGKADDEAAALRSLDSFRVQLDELASAGAALVWTVHNVLPHEARWIDVEAELHQLAADRADVVHVMSDDVAERCAPWYRLPADRTAVVPHPAYTGSYGPAPGRTEARRALGLPDAACALLLFGRLRPYKGLPELLAAHRVLAADDPGGWVLVVAGEPADDGLAETLEEARAHDDVVLLDRQVPAEDVPGLLAAADLAVLPYRRSLSSGSLALAAGAGLPAVLPDGDGAGWADDGWTVRYDRGDPDGLVGALRRGREVLLRPEAQSAARAAAALRSPERVADAMADLLVGAARPLGTGAVAR